MNTPDTRDAATYVGMNIRAERARNARTQQDLADHLGVSTVTVGKWERGETAPRADDLMRIAAFLHVPVADLFRTPVSVAA